MTYFIHIPKWLCFIAIFGFLSCGNDDLGPDLKNGELPANIWSRDSKNAVIASQTSDTVLITNISDPTVVFDSGEFKLWAGCVSADNSYAFICYSESVDGSNWSDLQIVFEPVTDPNAWDNQRTEVPTVTIDHAESDQSKKYKMWYGGSNKTAPDSTKIGLAYSADGITWERLEANLSLGSKRGLVMEPGFSIGDAGVVSDPTAYIKDGTYHIWYNSFGSSNDILISHAVSTNGYDWDKDNNNPIMTPNLAWESEGPKDITEDVSHPVVMLEPATGKFLMWYGSFDNSENETYSGLGFATSDDGSNW
ncbi:MAG: hypothetical protein ACR2MX_07970, partial [Cyclobacteriaceae bacterium]